MPEAAKQLDLANRHCPVLGVGIGRVELLDGNQFARRRVARGVDTTEGTATDPSSRTCNRKRRRRSDQAGRQRGGRDGSKGGGEGSAVDGANGGGSETDGANWRGRLGGTNFLKV
jgi:hypothetical protein